MTSLAYWGRYLWACTLVILYYKTVFHRFPHFSSILSFYLSVRDSGHMSFAGTRKHFNWVIVYSVWNVHLLIIVVISYFLILYIFCLFINYSFISCYVVFFFSSSEMTCLLCVQCITFCINWKNVASWRNLIFLFLCPVLI